MNLVPQPAKPILILDKISKSYGHTETNGAINSFSPKTSDYEQIYVTDSEEYNILSDLSITINSGEFVSIVGPSGCGKSTLLQLCGLLDQPCSGTITLGGVSMCYAQKQSKPGALDQLSGAECSAEYGFTRTQKKYYINKNHKKENSSGKNLLNRVINKIFPNKQWEIDRVMTQLRRDYIGFIYQFHHLLPEFSAIENIALPLMIKNTDSYNNIYKKAENILEKLNLSSKKHCEISALSGGERQRIAIARALIGNPALILADEPTGNLDRHNANEVFALLLSQVRQLPAAMLLVTHDHSLAQQADRRYELVGGRLTKW